MVITVHCYLLSFPPSRYLHLTSDELLPREHPDYDPHFKARPVAKHLLLKFQHYYYPRREISIDESMIGFQGRTSSKQFMPLKKYSKWGVKMWCLSEAKTGYLYRFLILGGRLAKSKEENKPSYAVLQLLRMEPSIIKNGHSLATDNFFTSPALAAEVRKFFQYVTCNFA